MNVRQMNKRKPYLITYICMYAYLITYIHTPKTGCNMRKEWVPGCSREDKPAISEGGGGNLVNRGYLVVTLVINASLNCSLPGREVYPKENFFTDMHLFYKRAAIQSQSCACHCTK
jgi:hypothetical protein